jgi:hypothetical protein
MADCLYLYKGKQYTFEQLADILAKGELAKLAENDIVDLSKYKTKSGKDAFEKNMVAIPKKEATVAEEPLQKTINSFNSALESIEANDLNAVILKVDEEGNLVPSMVAGKKGEVEGLVSKAGDIAWDIDSANKFTKALNKSFESTSKSKYKLVIADKQGFDNLHKAYYDTSAPEGTESFVDVERNLILINGDKATMTAPLHEAAHTWLPWAKEYAPELYKTGLDIIKESETYKEIDNLFKNYKEVYELELEDNIKNKMSQSEAVSKARKTAKKEVLKTNELKVWEDYFFKSKSFDAEKRAEFLADEILARAVEKEGSVKFSSKLAETFKNWTNKIYELIGKNLGFKGKTAEEIRTMSLDEFAKSIKEEIVNNSKFTDVFKTANEKRAERAKRQQEVQSGLLETEGLTEEGVAKQRVKVTVETKMKPITDTRAIAVIEKFNPEVYNNIINAISKTRLIEEQRKVSLNPDATAEQLASTVLGRIVSGELPIPKELEPVIGKIKGRAPSGLIGEAFKSIADFYNTTPKDVVNNIKSVAQQSAEPKKPAAKKPKTKLTFDEIQPEIEKLQKSLRELDRSFKAGKITRERFEEDYEDTNRKIDNLVSEVMGGEEEFTPIKEKVRPAKGYNDNVMYEDTDDGPLYKVGFGRRNQPVDIEETKKAVKGANLFKWLTWSKSSILTAGIDQALAAGKGYMSFYKKQNLFIANEMINKGKDFIKDWNSKYPDNKINGEKLSKILDMALKGDRDAFLNLSPELRDLVQSMRANIDNLSLAKVASGNLTFAEMDTYYDNLGTYVAKTYGKYTSTYRGNKILRSLLGAVGVDTRLDWQKEISEEDRLNAFVAISKEIDNGYADEAEHRQNKTSFVQRKRAIDALQKKTVNASQDITTHEMNEPLDKSTKEWRDWSKKLDKLKEKESNLLKEHKAKLDEYNKSKQKVATEIYNEIVSEVEPAKNYIDVSNKINKIKFEKRKDVPEWYKNLVKEEYDVYKNYFMTVGKLQESSVTNIMQQQILETGLRNGMIVKDEGAVGDSGQPEFRGYIKVGGETAITSKGDTRYGPLYGYKMHPDLHKVMFELPGINQQISSWNSAEKLLKYGGDVVLKGFKWVNLNKIVYNPSSIMRNFSSHFASDFNLAGTYWDAMVLTVKQVKNNKNMFHNGTDYYEAKGVKSKDIGGSYFKGLAEDAAKYGASETISGTEFDKLFNQISGQKSMIKAFDRTGVINNEAPVASMIDIAAKCVKYIPKTLTSLFLKGDYFPKVIHFELRRQNIAYKAYNQDYYSLNEKQQENCSRAAAANVRQDMAVPDMAGDITNLKFMGVVPKFAYEMQRNLYNSIKNSGGGGIKDQYDFLKWSDKPAENEAIIKNLNKSHRTRKQIGLAMYTKAYYGAYLIGSTLYNKATGKEDKDNETQQIMHFGQPNDQNSSLYNEIGDYINTEKDDINPQQAMRAVIPDFLRSHEVYGEYDPTTKKLKYWDSGRNDMYMPAVSPIRGLMYNINPTQSLWAATRPALSKGLATVADVSDSYFGGTIGANIIIDNTLGPKNKYKTPWESTKDIMFNTFPSDFIAYRKNLDQAKNSETSFVDALGKFFDDTYIKGLQGRYFEVDVDKKLSKSMKVVTDAYADEMKYVMKQINSNIAIKSGSKDFFNLSNQEKYEIMNKPRMKEYVKMAEKELNETSRKYIKNLRYYYLAAQKFGFTEEEIDNLFEKKEMNLLDMGLLKAMPLYRNKQFDGNIRSLLQLTNDEINNLDFSNLIEDKTYYIDK